MKASLADKPRITPVTDPTEIESIKRGGYFDLNGWQERDGTWWSYSYSLEHFRARAGKREKGDG